VRRPVSKSREVVVGIRVPELLRDVLQGIVTYVRERRRPWHVRFVDADKIADLLRDDAPDGAITSEDDATVAGGHELPIVNIIHDLYPTVPSVLADELTTGRTAAEYLIARGYREFAYVGIDARWSHRRYDGFAAALREAGFACHTLPSGTGRTHYDTLNGAHAANALQAWTAGLPKPLAVLVCTDHLAAAALEVWTAAGVRVPEDVAVLGVGNLIATCELARVPLSSVGVDFTGIGHRAARVLDSLMAGRRPPAKPPLLPPLGVVTRRSTDAFLFDDENVRAASRIINDRAAEGLTMKDLLRQIPVSRQWLDVRFKALVGRTMSEEIRRVRLARVRELLLNTDMPVQQIATSCGFSQVENLIRFFRDAHGTPPAAYRARHR
jgi:LacI family transcriptional regulator